MKKLKKQLSRSIKHDIRMDIDDRKREGREKFNKYFFFIHNKNLVNDQFLIKSSKFCLIHALNVGLWNEWSGKKKLAFEWAVRSTTLRRAL